MKEYLARLIATGPATVHGRNIMREYLQARILSTLQRSGAMVSLAFHGGTALRFLYATPRYSEDLDFALEGDVARYDFRALLRTIESSFAAENYRVEIKLNDQKIVHSAFIRFPGLLYELALSPHADEVMAVKLEVDTNPPVGAVLATTVIRRYMILQLYHHDRSSLLAGKLHAVLQRPYTKGRDLYDLFWYLSDPGWPDPNLTLLNNALQQTGWTEGTLTSQNWRQVVRQRLANIAWEQVVGDVSPFLEDPAQASLLTQANVLRLL